jgi:ABC-type Fe3+-hydroxamate transport system substrate-binding protein
MKVMKRTWLSFLLIGLVVVIGVAVVYQQVFSLARHGDGQWGGKVVMVDSTALTVADVQGTTHTFVVTPETKIVSGRQEITLLQISVGTFVLVKTGGRASTEAKSVRVVTTGYDGVRKSPKP